MKCLQGLFGSCEFLAEVFKQDLFLSALEGVLHQNNEVKETILVVYKIKKHLNFEMSRLGCHGLILSFDASIQIKKSSIF